MGEDKKVWENVGESMSEIPIEIIYPIVAVSMGLVGSVTRIFIQYNRDGQLPTDGLSMYAKSFIGCIAGLVSWLVLADVGSLKSLALIGLTAGYSGSDFVENILSDKNR